MATNRPSEPMTTNQREQEHEVNRLKAIWWIILGRSVAFRVVVSPSGLRANGFRRLYFTESRIRGAVPVQGADEDDIEYLKRMHRDRPGLTLADLGFTLTESTAQDQPSEQEPADG